jgi:PKD domain
LCFIVLLGTIVLTTDSIRAYSPHSVESTIRNNWNDTYGYKSSNMTNGVNIVYDVYSEKYFDGGYRIVNKNFGNGTQPYINFRGWAINFGYKRHTSTNHDTYIVAQNRSDRSIKIYKTDHLNISATEDVEYNNQGSGVWNECPSNATKKDNIEDCNMRYDNVGFDAYLPLEDLFPDISQDYSYNLFIVKEVDGHIVYTPLVLPFEFDKHTYQGGEVDLTSGVNANKLLMLGTNVFKRAYPRQTNASYGYFSTGYTYTKIDSNEDETAIWYGVSTDGTKRWGSTAYWEFGGNQAQLNFKADDKPPVHISHSLGSSIYQNGNDYWTQPNDQVVINLRQLDVDSGNRYQYLRLDGSGQDVRSRHIFTSGASDKTNLSGFTSSYLSIDSASRTENTTYGRVNWFVTPKRHADSFNIMYYYTDLANNSVGYGDTGMNLRVDGVEPLHQSQSVSGAKYVDGNTYWVNSNDELTFTVRQYDAHSGNKYQYLRALNDGNTSDIVARSRHDFDSATTTNHKQVINGGFTIESALRTENTGSGYGTVQWKVVPQTHGSLYTVQRYYQDNVNNNSGYSTIGTVGVDDVAPTVTFSPNSQGWTEGSININMNISDEHSGVKRFRYRTQNEGVWSSYSSWISEDSMEFIINTTGQNRIHIQAEDNVGNVSNNYSGYYYINNPPIADFDWNPKPVYEGDRIQIENLSIDPDGHNMTAEWTITNSTGQVTTSEEWNPVINNAQEGDYTVHLIVTDEIGATDEITKTISVVPLTITGNVYHTEKWEEIHEELNNQPNVFYSGEKFLLEANVTDYDIEKVRVIFEGKQITNETLMLQKELLSDHPRYYGDLYHESMSSPVTRLQNGSVYFLFEATWSNGVVKRDLVTVQIEDLIHNAYDFYRSN